MGGVYDPTNLDHPFGLLEVKWPYTHKEHTPVKACSDSKLCCELNDGMIRLKMATLIFVRYLAIVKGSGVIWFVI